MNVKTTTTTFRLLWTRHALWPTTKTARTQHEQQSKEISRQSDSRDYSSKDRN